MKEQIEAVQRMQDYIEAHLDEDISPSALARASMFSPWYALRLFAQFTGYTPADYIRRLRLSRSAMKLRDEGGRILDAALEAGFGSAEGYQRAFYRCFGCNPREYARAPVPIRLFIPYGVKYKNMEEKKTMEKTRNIFIQPIERPACRVAIRRAVSAEDYWAYCNEVGCDIWGLLKSMCRADGEPLCLWLPGQYILPGTSRYVQGAERAAGDDSPLPEGFDEISLPAATYLVFRGEPFAEEDFEQAISEVWEAIRKYDPAPFGYAWDDANPRIQLEPVGERGYIELMPVKKI